MACGPCNQRLKGNLFPLLHPERRARSHRDDISHEEPLLLHPHDDEPSNHIRFREEVAFAVDGSVRGQATIEILQLNRPDLIESRRGLLDMLTTVRKLCAVLQNFIRARENAGVAPPPELLGKLEEIDATLQNAVEAAAEFVSMSRATLG